MGADSDDDEVREHCQDPFIFSKGSNLAKFHCYYSYPLLSNSSLRPTLCPANALTLHLSISLSQGLSELKLLFHCCLITYFIKFYDKCCLNPNRINVIAHYLQLRLISKYQHWETNTKRQPGRSLKAPLSAGVMT